MSEADAYSDADDGTSSAACHQLVQVVVLACTELRAQSVAVTPPTVARKGGEHGAATTTNAWGGLRQPLLRGARFGGGGGPHGGAALDDVGGRLEHWPGLLLDSVGSPPMPR